MRFLLISTLATIGVFIAFAVGLFTQQTALMMGGFCAWTPVIFMLGMAVGKAGQLRSPIVFNEQPQQIMPTQPQRRVPLMEKAGKQS